MSKKILKLPNGEEIEYQLAHRDRQTVGLKITNDGLVVHAPKRIFNFQLQKILKQKANWISKKLASRRNNYVPPISWSNHETLQLLGNDITLMIVNSATNKQVIFDQSNLHLSLKAPTDTEAIKHKVMQWYKKQAQQDFARRLEIFAAKLGVKTPPLRLSNAQSRWGSCSSRGDIRLSWRLLQAPPQIINYVICHELAHLKEMNHSANFWAVVASIFPDYKAAEKALKAISSSLHRM